MARGFAARAAIPVAALAVLGACSLVGGNSVTCPSVGPLPNAGQLTRLASGPGKPTGIAFEAQVGSLAAECTFDGETRVGSIDLDVLFRARRGSAGSAAKHGFRYFVAVVDPEGGVAIRKAFSVLAEFEGSGTEVEKEEELVLSVPIGQNSSLAAYRVYVGMKLTREQLERNLGRRR